MRNREKQCFNCEEIKKTLFRCKYNKKPDWVFICEKCLKKIKKKFCDNFIYGGTWKSNKK